MLRSKSIATRLTGSTLVAASIMTMAAPGNAANLANFGVGDWTGKSTKLGSFGAGYGAEFTMDFNNGALSGEASGNASIQLFGKTMSIVDIGASANINDSSSDGANLYAEIVGVTVYEKSFNDGFVFDASEDISNYDDLFCVQFFDVSTTFVLGVVPITLAAGAQGCANITFSATPQYNTTTRVATLNMDVTPGLGVDLSVSAGVGSSAFSVGVEANVSLLDFTVPITLDPSYGFSNSAFSYQSTGNIDLSMLDGSFDVYAKADLGFWDVKYSTTIFDWEGLSTTFPLWSTGKPTASSAMVEISGAKASGKYVYSDTAGTAEGTTTYAWYRNTSATDAGRTLLSSSTNSSTKDRVLTVSDNGRFLQFCVTPKNAVGTSGTTHCSPWQSVGQTMSLFEHDNYGGTGLSIAYENKPSGTCYNVSAYISTFNDKASSYKLYASHPDTNFVFFKDANCSGGQVTRVVNGTNQQTSMTNDMGSSWNDALSSVMVVYNESVSAENVTVEFEGNKADAAYMFNVGNSENTDESGSTYKWYRANSASGSGSALISGSTGSSHSLTSVDDGKYLKVCVKPSNGYTIGSEVCSGWTSVGALMNIFQHGSYGGTQLSFAYLKAPSGTCYNLTDYSFNDVLSSYIFRNGSAGTASLVMYENIDCDSNPMLTRSVGVNGTESISFMGTSFGSSWNDNVSSFKVVWTSQVSLSNLSMTINGAKAVESHTYSGGGYAETSKYAWYRADNSSGTNTTIIEGATDREYMLTGNEQNKYLKVCVTGSNQNMVAAQTLCSGWVSVGRYLRLYSDPGRVGINVNVAYEKSASSTCFNLADYDFDDFTTSLQFYAPSAVPAKVRLYKSADCAGGYGVFSANAGGSPIVLLSSNSFNDAVSSVMVVY